MVFRGSITRLASAKPFRLPLVISDEISHALSTKSQAVVSLESTIITHGLPFPQNLEMVQEVELTIRKNGAIPATCAFLNGKPHIGLSSSQLTALAELKDANKVSRRDVGYVMANGQNGGTTIALTMILSSMAGIKVFATGGLGGVHRDGQFTMDISADLTELGRTPVSVVCAGPKSILDIGLTLEYLETQGVFVGTYSKDSKSVDIPGFYARESGFRSPYAFGSYAEAANIIHNQNNVMNLQSGSILCIPPSVETAMPSEMILKIIIEANEEAKALGISGKELTPFLLGRIAKVTEGKSVKSNIELVLNNARAATEIAKELLNIEKDEVCTNSTSII